jgi:hypothetical protein
MFRSSTVCLAFGCALSRKHRCSTFLILVSYRARCVSRTFLVRDAMSSLLYLSRRIRGVQVVSYFFGFSVHTSQRSLPSLWSVTNVRRLSCHVMRLFCCNKNQSAWIDCSKNSKYEISWKNVRWEVHCSTLMGGRSGWRNDGYARTRTHMYTYIYAGR